MQPDRVVEILQGSRSVGTGYLIAPRHVLTARHVVEPNTEGTRCEIWPLSAVGAEALPLAKRKRPRKLKAQLAWYSRTDDFAVLAIERNGVAGILPETVPLGRVRDDGLPFRYIASGLPEASGDQERRIEGTMNWVRPELRFDLNISNGRPKQASAWAGFSGAAIFSGGLLVAVARRVDENWGGGVLEATPVQFLLEDTEFATYCDRACLQRPTELPVARYNVPLVDSLAARLHLIDRDEQAEQIRGCITTIGERQTAVPLVFVISGVDEDEHRHLIKRLANEPRIKRRLGKNAPPERVIAELFWPNESCVDPAARLRDGLAAELWKVIGPPNALETAQTDPVQWRKLFDKESTTRGFWIMLRRARAGRGHAALLSRWLDLWGQLGPGRLVVLFLCIAWDLPPAPQPSPIPAFLRRGSSITDSELEQVIEQIINQEGAQAVSELTEIPPDDVAPWIEQVRPFCHFAAPEQLDGLRSLMLHFIGDGKRLRPIDRQLGALRLQFESHAGTVLGESR